MEEGDDEVPMLVGGGGDEVAGTRLEQSGPVIESGNDESMRRVPITMVTGKQKGVKQIESMLGLATESRYPSRKALAT